MATGTETVTTWTLTLHRLRPRLRIRQRLRFAFERPDRIAVRQAPGEAEPVPPRFTPACCRASVYFALAGRTVNLVCIGGLWYLINAAAALYLPHIVLPHLYIRQRIRITRSLRIAVGLRHLSLLHAQHAHAAATLRVIWMVPAACIQVDRQRRKANDSFAYAPVGVLK